MGFELIEQLATLEHDRWSRWMAYLFTKGTSNEDGSFTIQKESVDRWTRQLNTPYKDLSEEEQNSDRMEALRSMKVFVLAGKNPHVEAWSHRASCSLGRDYSSGWNYDELDED